MKMIKFLWVKWSRKIDASKIIAGQSKPSTGNISAKKAVVAYLPQHLLTTDGATYMEEIKALEKFL
jgi:ATPase subunit of ABC transporter with duplicated ATPase domains